MKERCLQRDGGANGSICGPRVATIARRRLGTQASSACSERSFSKAGLICGRNRMMLKPEHVDALSLLGWHAMREKELLKQGE